MLTLTTSRVRRTENQKTPAGRLIREYAVSFHVLRRKGSVKKRGTVTQATVRTRSAGTMALPGVLPFVRALPPQGQR